MDDRDWNARSELVTERMKRATRAFATPLVEDVTGRKPRIGSGSYIERSPVCLLTCEHVAVHQPQLHLPHGTAEPIPCPSAWRLDPHPVDAALAEIDAQTWSSTRQGAEVVPLSRFASRHAPVQHELLFFYGLANENSYASAYGFQRILSGYCSQEKPNSGDAAIFEILWEPSGVRITEATHPDAKARVRYQDPAGYSGSLVWNTRFVELGCDVNTWSPADAVVTGLLRRWDTTTKTLLAWRVEHLLAWL